MKVTWKFLIGFFVVNVILAAIGAYVTYHVNKKLDESAQIKE